MKPAKPIWAPILIGALVACMVTGGQCGIIKDLFQKVTNTNNRTEETVKQSAPICGSGAFSTPDERSLSPEIIFITNRASKSEPATSSSNFNDQSNGDYSSSHNRNRDNWKPPTSTVSAGRQRIKEVANEFRFHTENVTLEELERYGFNPDAPVTFLMHGFTSGYPLQAWISAIVEAYTIDRETGGSPGRQKEQYQNEDQAYTGAGSHHHQHQTDQRDPLSERHKRSSHRRFKLSHGHRRHTDHKNGTHSSDENQREAKRIGGTSSRRLKHNLFIINWNYAARGILYPRAVANIPIVASYVTRFINDRLIGEARVDPRHIQLIGHSLGAHLAGFIGKNTREKVGRIYGLDPAGPCFGAISGPLYPSSKRLAPGDAHQVISVHTNSALLGIDKPLGGYSIFVEGGEVQPGCKGGGVIKSIGTLTWDGGDFDTVACSHSRAPNLLTYRHDQSDSDDDCQLVAYGCKDWTAFSQGHCGICHSSASTDDRLDHERRYGLFSNSKRSESSPFDQVDCLRIGLDWQYPTNGGGRPSSQAQHGGHNHNREPEDSEYHDDRSTTRRPGHLYDNPSREEHGWDQAGSRSTTRRPYRTRRGTTDAANSTERRRSSDGDKVEAKSLFLRTGDTQPYCAFHYQVILELNEPFRSGKKPPISILLQDSEPESGQGRRPQARRGEQNSLSNDEFGNKFNDKIYTHLLTSNKKLKRVDHGTLLFRDGLENGHKILKAIHVNYMSHSNPQVRKRLSSQLCLVKTDTDRSNNEQLNRFYFEPCGLGGHSNSYHNHHQGGSEHHHDQNLNDHDHHSDHSNSAHHDQNNNHGKYDNQGVNDQQHRHRDQNNHQSHNSYRNSSYSNY